MPSQNNINNKNVIIIPVYNEARTISGIIEEILELKNFDLIVINDGSLDTTEAILYKFANKIKMISLPSNCGKGYAMRTGADIAYSDGYSKMIFMDGDGQHSPRDIEKIMEGLDDHDLAINRRILKFKTSFISKFGRFMVRNIFNLFFGTSVSDHLSGFRAFRSTTYPKIRWRCDDYRVEIEMLARAFVNKVSCCEISTPCGRRRYSGMGWGSGFLIMIYIFWCRIFSRKLLANESKNKN